MAELLRDSTAFDFDRERRLVFQAGSTVCGAHVVQLASKDSVVLFHIQRALPGVLREILENERIRKFGSG